MKFILTFVKYLTKLYFVIYAFVHICFLMNPFIVQYLTFSNFINFPRGNLSNPTKFELDNVHNFYLNTEENITVGVWHFLPSHVNYSYELEANRSIHDHLLKYLKSDERPVVVYVHGNAQNRAFKPRRKLCTRLSLIGYHVFSIDYRGYGDSTGTPSESGVVHDVTFLYNLLRLYRNESKLYLWGHSLGTAIVAHTSKILSEKKQSPAGVILESAFLNMSHAATEYLIAPLFYNNQWIRSIGDKALEELNIHFNTDKNIVKINSKILIFHAEDDWIIPHDRGLDLMRIAKNERPKDYPQVELKVLDREHGLGHSKIYQHEEIYPIVKEFIQ